MARKSRITPAPQTAWEALPAVPAGLYTRLSVEADGDGESNSLTNQRKLGISFFTQHPEIKLVDTYTDNGFTGMNYARPDFHRMMDDLRSGRIRCVIVKDISRLGRHFAQTAELVERTFPKMGVRLICINDSYDSESKDADAAALTLPLKMVMNDYYVKDIARKIRSGIAAKIDSGTYLPSSGSVPYGYIRCPERNTYDVDAEAAPIVVRIFEMRADGMSLNGIAARLNREGVPCPGKLRYDRGISKDKRFENANWIRSTLRKILSDEVYLGKRIHGRLKSSKYGDAKVNRDSSRWQIVENAHPAMISRELFARAQAVSEETARRRQAFGSLQSPNADYRDILRGKMICGDCGASMSPGKVNGRATSPIPVWLKYDCNTYRYSNHTKCKSHYIRQETVMKAVSDLLNQQVLTAADIERLLEDIKGRPATVAYIRRAREQHMHAVAQRKELEKKLNRLLIDLSRNLISRREYDYIKERYAEQLAASVSAEAHALADRNALDSAMAASQKWLAAIREYQRIPEVTAELVDALIDRIEVIDGKTVRIKLKYSDPYRSIYAFRQRMEREQNAG